MSKRNSPKYFISLLSLALCLFLGQTSAATAQPSALTCEKAIIPAKSSSVGAQFLLQRKQPDHTAPSVERAAKIAKQEQGKTLIKPVEKVEAWIQRYQSWLVKYGNTPRAQRLLLQSFYNEYVVKKEDIPQSFYDLQVRIYQETGRGHLVLDQNQRDYLAKVVIADQKASLKVWFDYLFLSPETQSIPFWVKVWSFQGITKLAKFDPESGDFSQRSKGQAAPFPGLDKVAFQNVAQLITNKIESNKVDPLMDDALVSHLAGANFGKMYGRALYIEIHSKLATPTVAGKWVKYEQGSDAQPLVDSLACKNTGWCTEGYATAQDQLTSGDFYVYYSLNASGQATEPRIAIRMNGTEIDEVRGIAKGQNLDDKISKTKIVEDKLAEFGRQGERYKRRSQHMKKLSLIEQKHLKNIALTKEELTFLYEIDSHIEGFGQAKDPRINALIEQRDARKDLALLFNCQPENISLHISELSRGNIKVHKGDLELGWKALDPNMVFPEIVVGSVAFGNHNIPSTHKLPRIITGSLIWPTLKNATDYTFPERIGGSLMLPGLETAQGLILPKKIDGDLDLRRLSSAQGLHLPKELYGSLYLMSLKSAEGLILPEIIHGVLNLEKLLSAKGLRLPQKTDGEVFLDSLTSTEGLIITEGLRGIRLKSLATAHGLTFPQTFHGDIDLSNLMNAQGLKLPRSLWGHLYLLKLKTSEDLFLPETIYGNLNIASLRSIKGLKLPHVQGKTILREGVRP